MKIKETKLIMVIIEWGKMKKHTVSASENGPRTSMHIMFMQKHKQKLGWHVWASTHTTPWWITLPKRLAMSSARAIYLPINKNVIWNSVTFSIVFMILSAPGLSPSPYASFHQLIQGLFLCSVILIWPSVQFFCTSRQLYQVFSCIKLKGFIVEVVENTEKNAVAVLDNYLVLANYFNRFFLVQL